MAIVAVYVNVFDWHTTLECVDYPNLLMARVEEICRTLINRLGQVIRFKLAQLLPDRGQRRGGPSFCSRLGRYWRQTPLNFAAW